MTYSTTQAAMDEQTGTVQDPELREALADAYRLLKQTYNSEGRVRWSRDQMGNLAYMLNQYGPDPDLVVQAVEAHISDTTEVGDGTRKGALTPKPADILAHIEALEQRERREQARDEDETRALQVREWMAQEAADRYRGLDLTAMTPDARKFWERYTAAAHPTRAENPTFIWRDGDRLMVPQRRDWQPACAECTDGKVTYWGNPKDARRVYLDREYRGLAAALQTPLKAFTTICDQCRAGDDQEVRFRGALYGTADHPKVMLTYEEVRARAAKRKAYDEEQLGLAV